MPHNCDGSFDQRDLMMVMIEWETALDYFPRDPAKQSIIMGGLAALPRCRSELFWLKDRLIQDGPWRSIQRMRELFCIRFPPADGIEADSYRGEMAAITAAPPPNKFLPPPPDDPVKEIELAILREKMESRLRAGTARTDWPQENRPPFKLRARELHELEEKIAESAAQANLHRRNPEDFDRAVEDLKLALEQRRQKPND